MKLGLSEEGQGYRIACPNMALENYVTQTK